MSRFQKNTKINKQTNKTKCFTQIWGHSGRWGSSAGYDTVSRLPLCRLPRLLPCCSAGKCSRNRNIYITTARFVGRHDPRNSTNVENSESARRRFHQAKALSSVYDTACCVTVTECTDKHTNTANIECLSSGGYFKSRGLELWS